MHRPDGIVAHIKINMKAMLTDGEGNQKALEWNGPASLRPTFYFANVWMLDSGMEWDGYVEIDCSDRSLMRKWDRDRWYRNIDAVLDARRRHANGEMTQTEHNRPDKAERQGLADPSAASALTVPEVPDLDRRPAGRCVLRSFGSERHAWHAWLSMQSPERRSEQGLLQRLEGVTETEEDKERYEKENKHMYIPRHCRQYLNGEPDPQPVSYTHLTLPTSA